MLSVLVIISNTLSSCSFKNNQRTGLKMIAKIEAPLCHLGEGPLWNEVDQKLYWTDILNQKIYSYSSITKHSKLFWNGEMIVGGFTFNQDDSLILCSEKGLFKLTNNTCKKLQDIPMIDGERFNDVIADPKGRIFAGTLKSSLSEGILYRLEKDKSPAIVLKNIGISNGMCFSADQKSFFHTDSMARTITRFDYNIESGDLKNPTLIYQGSEQNGFPDGITMDNDGNIWIACWGASKVLKISETGEILAEIKTPASQPSSLTFGGDSLTELFITSACPGGSNLEKGLDKEGNFLGGFTYSIKLDVKGRAEFKTDF